MAMSRITSRSLLHRISLIRPTTFFIRHRSNKSNHAQLIEVDLDSASSTQSDSPDAINLGIDKLEDAIHSVFLRYDAPGWLPFLPGYSYWVPPRGALRNHSAAGGMMKAIDRLTSCSRNLVRNDLNSVDEKMSRTSSRGWPSTAFFIEGTSPKRPIPMIKVVEVNVEDIGDETSSSEDEQG